MLANSNRFAYYLSKGDNIMSRTSNIFARVEPEIKEQAEIVLNQLGIPMSNAVGMFLRQVIMHRGIPFEMKIPTKRPFVINEHTKEELDAEIAKGLEDIEKGRVYSEKEVFDELRKNYKL